MLLFLLAAGLAHTCSHSVQQVNITQAETRSYPGRSNIVGNMRVSLQYVGWGYLSTDQNGIALKSSASQAAKFLSKLLTVTQEQIKINLFTCSGVSVPLLMKGIWLNQDLVIFMTTQLLGLVKFSSSACVVKTSTPKRVLFGRITQSMLNTLYIYPTSQTGFQSNIRFILHEMVHLCGFSPSLYSYWANTSAITTVINGTTYMVTGNVTAQVNSYYHCNTLGMPMQSLSPSHWMKDALKDELMVGNSFPEDYQFISGMTLGALQDTNWFNSVNTSYAQTSHMTFGEGKGCGFISKPTNCSLRPQFSDPLVDSLTYYQQGFGVSQPDIYSSCLTVWAVPTGNCRKPDYIGAFLNLSATLQSPGWRSMAYQGSVHTLDQYALYDYRCASTYCSEDYNSLIVTIGNTNYTCQVGGFNITNSSVFTGVLTCPANITSFCLSINTCTDACNASKMCVNRQCIV